MIQVCRERVIDDSEQASGAAEILSHSVAMSGRHRSDSTLQVCFICLSFV